MGRAGMKLPVLILTARNAWSDMRPSTAYGPDDDERFELQPAPDLASQLQVVFDEQGLHASAIGARLNRA